MPINATCQMCGATLPVPDEYAGKAVRCGGCQGVVQVPSRSPVPASPAAPGVPVAKASRPRPVAVPVAAKERPAKADTALPKARKLRDEDADVPRARKAEDDDPPAADDDLPKARKAEKRRPIAKRRRDSILTAAALKWLSLCLVTGTVGLGVLAYAAWGASRKNDGTAYVPADDNPAPPPVVPPAARPAPAAPPPVIPFEPPEEARRGFDPAPGAVDPFNPNAPPAYANHRPAAVVPPRVDNLPFRACTNAVLAAQAGQYTVSASTQFDLASWPVPKAFDNDAGTSWYSSGEGAAAKPWLQVTFARPVVVSRVVVLGNRDQYGASYTVRAGTLTLLDTNNRELSRVDQRGGGAKSDFEFAVGGVRAQTIRFTVTEAANAGMCVAVGELQVE